MLDEREENLFNIAIWAIRRIPSKSHKESGLKALLKQYHSDEVEYGIVEVAIKRVEETGHF